MLNVHLPVTYPDELLYSVITRYTSLENMSAAGIVSSATKDL